MESTIYIPRPVYQKIMHWVHNKDECECSGIMSVMVQDGDFHVVDAFMVKQTNGKAETEMDPDAIGKLEYEHFSKKRPGELKLWWHSHVDMKVFWSGDDRAAIEQNGKHGYYLATVFNKRGDILSCLYQGEPYRIFVDEIETVIWDPLTKEVTEAWNAEYKAAVKIKKEQIHVVDYGSYGSHYAGPVVTTTKSDDAPQTTQSLIEDRRSKVKPSDLETLVHPDKYDPLTEIERARFEELLAKSSHEMTDEEWEELQELEITESDELEEYREMYYERLLQGMGVES